MNLVVVGFIAFLVEIVHGRRSSKRFIGITNYQFTTRVSDLAWRNTGNVGSDRLFVISAGERRPPIEKLLTSTSAIVRVRVFGIPSRHCSRKYLSEGFFSECLSEIGGARLAVPVTAVLFALLHLPQLGEAGRASLLIFVVGYVLSLVRQRSNSLIPSFIIHTSYNAMLVRRLSPVEHPRPERR